MNPFKVEETPEAFVPFQVRGPDGAPFVEINDFLQYLATCGRSAYTPRSYAMRLAHFFGWLRTSGIDLWTGRCEPPAHLDSRCKWVGLRHNLAECKVMV